MSQHTEPAPLVHHGEDERFDFIVVGSGAGGGPLAANLAEAGWRVLLLEAGSERRCSYYDVPLMHARASEDADMRWDFFVRHYHDDVVQRRDHKFREDKGGVWYPRGSTLGGSTAISALITVYPHHGDWDRIAELTGDDSWRAENMRRYFQRLERWSGPDVDRDNPAVPGDASRHGFDGWLGVSRAQPKLAGREPWFLKIIDAFEQASREILGGADDVPLPHDPNDWRVVDARLEGMSFIPVAVADGVRNGARERVLSVRRAHPERLVVRLGSLATRVLFEGRRAVGVEYLDGAHLYRADPKAVSADRETSMHPRRVHANREVILAGGAFNTPQLLKLSGIGPRGELEGLGIDVRVDAPGVGANLQDRYEVSVIHRLVGDYSVFEGAALDCPLEGEIGDRLYEEWNSAHDGPYTTNGSLAGFVKRSSVAGQEPDLFVFALPIHFRGYYPGYADDVSRHHDMLSVLVLKAHTKNAAGRVTLRSADPRDPPRIDFHYFDDDDPHATADDLHGTIDGVELARRISRRLGDIVAEELVPGAHVQTRAQLAQFVRDEAWGHHASCTCKIGSEDDPTSVLDGDFRVRGVEGLRVVDASVFPAIPGFFIASAVYMVSEKASDVILRDQAM